jgi:hypothetical protein
MTAEAGLDSPASVAVGTFLADAKDVDSLANTKKNLTHDFEEMVNGIDGEDYELGKEVEKVIHDTPSIIDETDDATSASGASENFSLFLNQSKSGAWQDADVDGELDAAVQRAILGSDSMSQVSKMDDDDNFSVSSNAKSVSSVKSAVQLRLESRKKPEPLTKEAYEAKLAAAEDRKLSFMQEIAEKRHSRLQKVSSARSVLEEKHDAEIESRKKLLDMKLHGASERKDYFLNSKTGQLRAKNEKVSSTLSILEQQRDEEAQAIRQKWEAKIEKANMKKESTFQEFSEKMQAKMDKIAQSKDTAKSAIQTLSKKIEEKMDAARVRKEEFDLQTQNKVEGYVHKTQERKELLLKSTHDNASSKRLELEEKSRLAAERKQQLLEEKKKKVKAYLELAYKRGQEATKKKESMSCTELQELGEAPDLSLRSIGEEREFDPMDDKNQDLIEKLALQWLDDENSVASFSTQTSKKSKAQLRLEKYQKASPSKSDIDAKLEAAASRRESLLESSIKGALETNDKINKVQSKQEAKKEKVAKMQEKLEAKLLAALERKEAVLAKRTKKASSSVCSDKGKRALEKKQKMVEKIRNKSERKLDSASSRRQQLKDLERQKKEIMMLRREMAKSLNTEDKLESMQKKLDGKMASAIERKAQYIAAKQAKAAEHISSTIERGQEALHEEDDDVSVTKTRVEEKLEAAERRRQAQLKKDKEKREKINARRRKARELALQRRAERKDIEGWEEESLAPVNEDEEMSQADLSVVSKLKPRDSASEEDNESTSSAALDQRRLAAKQQLVEEIRLANEAKMQEMERLTEEIRRAPRRSERPSTAASFGTIDTNEVLSFDEGEMDNVSISGLSALQNNENKAEANKKAQAALALAELDIKLSEIQLMQAILLAEEASLSGKSEFKTTDKSAEDLQRVKVTEDFEREKRRKERKAAIKQKAKTFFAHTVRQANVAKRRTAQTLSDIKSKLEQAELDKLALRRPSSAQPSAQQ